MSTEITFSSRRSLNIQTSVLQQCPDFNSASKIDESATVRDFMGTIMIDPEKLKGKLESHFSVNK